MAEASGLSRSTKIGIAIVICVVVVLAAVGIGLLVWYFWPSSDKLPNPTLPMSLLHGPYGVTQGISVSVPPAPELNNIDLNTLKSNTPDLWGKFGYRFVEVNDNVVDLKTKSDILWFNKDGNDVFRIRDTEKTENINFMFWIPQPGNEKAVSGKIHVQLVLSAWENANGTGKPKDGYEEIYVGLSENPTSSDHIYVQYSTFPKYNQLLKTV